MQDRLAQTIRRYSGFRNWPDEVAQDIAALSLQVVPEKLEQHFAYCIGLTATAMSICDNYAETGRIFYKDKRPFKLGQEIALEGVE